MTVSVPAQLVYSSSGDGVTSQFPYPVRVLEAGELVVALSESGVETTLVLNTDYTLSGIGDEAGVTVTLIEVPTASQTVIRYRATAAKQIVNLEDRAKNSAEAIEQQLDRMTMVDQDQDRRIGDLEDVADELDQAVDDAAASATAAATSATNAATSAGNAADSATAAAASAATIEIGTGSDLSIDPAKLLKRGDAADAIDAAVTPVVATRTALAAVATADHAAAYLTEAGREGTFLWRGSNLSTLVAADTSQVIYVAPASDPTGASGAWVRLHNTGEFLIEWAGGKRNDTTFDNKAAHDAAVAVLLATGFNVLLFATGVYTYLSAPAPHTFGVQLKGAGHGSALDNGATNLERRFNQTNTAAFLKWDGTGPEFNSTGGGIQRLNVVAASGTSGGVAVHLYATSDSQRPGYFEISHVLVWGTSGGTWAYALIQDGSNCTTASGQGLRDVAFTNVYLSGATVETCQIINGTNNQYMGLYVYQAGGSSAVMRITGTSSASTSKSTNGFGSIYVSGDLILQNCDHQILFGYATTLTVTGDTTNSKFYGDYSSVVFSGITRYAAANSNNTQVFDKTTLQGIAGSTSGSRLAPDGIMEAWGQASIATTATTVTMGVTFGAAPNVQLTPINATACYANLTAQPTTTTFAAIANVGPINVGWRAVGRAA